MRKATVTFYGGLYYVTVETQMTEGHFQVISHAPFSKEPKFDTKDQAVSFAKSFGEVEISFTGYSI